MDESTETLRRSITFASCVLVVVILYWAQDVLVPVALAILLTFVLSPPVTWLERRLGRGGAVIVMAALVFTLLGLATWGIARQLKYLADDLPRYRANILTKIADVRGAGEGGSVEKLQKTVNDIEARLGQSSAPKGSAARPVVVAPQTSTGLSGFAWLGPLLRPLGTAGLVMTLVIFMLLEQRELRERLIGLFGQGRLAATTKALDEASRRVSRQLLMQSLVNLIYGVAAGIGLYLLGVPYALVWAALGAVLRFIPYVGPVIGAGVPIVVSLAALPGWIGPLSVLGFYVVLELFTNLVLETRLYAGAAGVSQVALLVSVAFWTWLWGPLGLLMATPLTVCLVVLGKHVPGLERVGMLMADSPALGPEWGYYQRLLAHDLGEAADLLDSCVKSEARDAVYDTLLLPALNYAERDRLEQRLSLEEEAAVIDATRELLADAVAACGRQTPEAANARAGADLAAGGRQRLLAYPIGGMADELALRMLSAVIADLPIEVEIVGDRLLASDFVSLVRERSVRMVCFGDLPPSPPSKTRYLVKRLHAALPDVQIIVGRWAPDDLADTSTEDLREAGAGLVAATLGETRAYLATLVGVPARPTPATIEAAS